jgi:beta-mannosidase
MRETCDLRDLPWRLSGWTPHLWRLFRTAELGEAPQAEVPAVPACVPGSVQAALLAAGLLPDWRYGDNARLCEWVEHRHWLYEVVLPEGARAGASCTLLCEGLDHAGEVFLNGEPVGTFANGHIPHRFPLDDHLRPGGNVLRIAFELPPRWLGQFGYTSRVREWKARFNYTWDWVPRLVQVGITGPVQLEWSDGRALGQVRARAGWDPQEGCGDLELSVEHGGLKRDLLHVCLRQGERLLLEETLTLGGGHSVAEFRWPRLAVEPWWPNGEGRQPLYQLEVALTDAAGAVQDTWRRRVGFRRVEWRPCVDAPHGADPWLCTVNGRPVFLQGVNSPPLLPNHADIAPEREELILGRYRDLGANTLRINGVGYLESEHFYDLCDEYGLLIWQDLPLSSSGVENVPPVDEEYAAAAEEILASWIARRGHHACLLLWCGGNELQRRDEAGRSLPLGLEHPLLARLHATATRLDPGRRFLPTTATGPRFHAEAADFGQGLHWNVHGPWKPWDDLTGWEDYWARDDSLFRAETGAPGAAPAELIRQYGGTQDPLPVEPGNSAWRRPLTWWLEADQFRAEKGRAPGSLEEYVSWSQERQARALAVAVRACKRRFPRCGGILLWCGHDCCPQPANTSLLDYHGNPKPAALAVGTAWRAPAGSL